MQIADTQPRGDAWHEETHALRREIHLDRQVHRCCRCRVEERRRQPLRRIRIRSPQQDGYAIGLVRDEAELHCTWFSHTYSSSAGTAEAPRNKPLAIAHEVRLMAPAASHQRNQRGGLGQGPFYRRKPL